MAAKVFDGFFLGDAETSMDGDFLDLNKISRLVNLAGMEVSNVWASQGFVYETYNWEDQPDYLVFPGMERDRALQDLIEFIDVSIRRGLSVLVFSLRGVSRNVFAVCAYLMYKYHWGFEKSYDFVLSKKSDIQINQGFVQQLFALEKRLHIQRQKLLQMTHPTLEQNDMEFIRKENLRKKEWDPAYLQSNHYGVNSINKKGMSATNPVRIGTSDEMDEDEVGDELLLIYSFLNSKNTITVMPGPFLDAIDIPKHFKLKFNSELQEEDIHMFPTQPSAPNLKAKFGILKRKKVSKATVKKVDAASEGLLARPLSATATSTISSANASAQIPVSGPGSVKISKGNENKTNGTAPTTTNVQVKGKESNKDVVSKENNNDNGTVPQLALSKVKESREVLKEISQSSDKGLGSSKQPTQNQVQGPQSSGTTASSSSASISVRSTSSVLDGRDLCEYVGVGVGVNGGRPEGGNIDQNGPSPEERLRSLMQDMQINGPGGVPRVEDNYDLKGRPGSSRSSKPTAATAANTTNDQTIDRCTEKSSDKRWDKSADRNCDKSSVKSNEKAISSEAVDRNTDKDSDPKVPQKSKNSTGSDASAVLSRYKSDGLSERDDGGERKRKDSHTSSVSMNSNGMGEYKGLYQDSNLSLSLYDLAALPLHSDRIASPKVTKNRDSSNADSSRQLSRSSSMGEEDDRETRRIDRSKREMVVTAALSRGTVPSNGRYSVGSGSGYGSGSQLSDRERDKERAKERERDHEFERERLRAIDRENAKDRAREREREMEWEREREREKARERERERDREAERAYKIQQHIINAQHRQSPQSVKKPIRKNLVLSEQERERERERETDLLATFQQRGNEAAVRVRYSNMPLSSSELSLNLNLNTPNKNVRKAWQEDPYNYRTNGTYDLKGRNTVNSTVNTTSTKPTQSIGLADRERERSSTQSVDSRMSTEREKVTPRTYR
jgi:protein-tyrosine phosphatase